MNEAVVVAEVDVHVAVTEPAGEMLLPTGLGLFGAGEGEKGECDNCGGECGFESFHDSVLQIFFLFQAVLFPSGLLWF